MLFKEFIVIFSVIIFFLNCKKDISNKIQAIEASSYVPRFEEFSFRPQNLIDKRLDTSWQFNTSSDRNPYLKIVLEEKIDVIGISVANGFQYRKHRSYGDLYLKNGRVKKVEILAYQDDEEIPVWKSFSLLLDKDGWQDLEIKSDKPTKLILVNFLSSYAGEKWNDTAVSEIRVLGR